MLTEIKHRNSQIHFADLGTTNYFAHTRIEDMADTKTRRVIEVQSDLFQRGRLELEKSRFEPELIDYSNGELVVTPAHRVDRTVEISKLVPYEDTWYERIIHEEVKKAAEDGKTRLQFPTGETAMKIEGLGQEAGGGMMFALRGFPIEPQDLKVGLEIYSEAQDADWIITDILADGKFNAVPKYMLGVHSLEDTIKALDSSGLENFERRKETFDISGTIDMSNPIYRFYEHRVQRCLKRYRPAMQRVTDRQRVTWFQIPLYPADATRPVSAFGVARPSHTSNSNTRVRHNT